MLMPTGYGHSPLSFLPVQELFSLNGENPNKSPFPHLSSTSRRELKEDISILRPGYEAKKDQVKFSARHLSPNLWYSKPEGRSAVFHWDTLNESRSEGGDGTISRRDDGVVLLVGLFNLLAVVVFVGHQIMTGELLNTNKRTIFWQIQKVLDEFVLKVHSSETASNLLARALNSPTEEVSGKGLNNIMSSFINQTFNEKDSRKLQKTLRKTVDRFRTEIFSSSNVRVSHISPFVYKPLKVLYRALTEPNSRGRALSFSLLQEMSKVAKIFQGMTLFEFQGILRAMYRLGKIHQRYDLIAMIKNTMPTKVWRNDYHETRSELSSNYPRRFRRATATPDHERIFQHEQKQRRNSRSPRFSEGRKKATENNSALELTKTLKKAHDKLLNKKGIVEDVTQEAHVTNWADGWLTLLTQASPVALDISTLYARSRHEPQCLRSYLCKANGYWRRRGIFQASLSPFFSVLLSWALEAVTPHSLGDSLIAVRAGWMGKACQRLFPECQHESIPNSIVKQSLKIFGNQQDETKLANLSSSILAKIDASTQHNEAPTYTKRRDPLFATPTTPPASPQGDFTHQPPSPLLAEQNHSHHQEIHHFRPYSRYDQPPSQEGTFLPSDSIAGMALQDRPLDRMDIYTEGEDERKEHPLDHFASTHHRFFAWKAEENLRGEQANSSQPTAESSDYVTKYISRTLPGRKGEKHNGPSILHQTDYSSYMALQQPLSTRQSHRSIIHQLNMPSQQSPSDHDTPPDHKDEKPLKYKYGLRRGLPSRNVDGFSPLGEVREKVPKPFKLDLRKKKEGKGRKRDNLTNHHTINEKAVINSSPQQVTKNRKSSIKHQFDTKHNVHFTYKDAITGKLTYPLLYQYFRDR